jgi:hypothetical protein
MSQPAFPQSTPIENQFHPNYGKDRGMALRDYFAAKALSSPICLELSSTNNWDNERRSEWAYKQADAMLKAREA